MELPKLTPADLQRIRLEGGPPARANDNLSQADVMMRDAELIAEKNRGRL